MTEQTKHPQETLDIWDTQRILHDAELINGGAAMHEGRLEVTDSQLEDLAKEVPPVSLTSGISPKQPVQGASANLGSNAQLETAGEPEMSTFSDEELSAILAQSPGVAYLSIDGSRIPESKRGGYGGFQPLFNTPRVEKYGGAGSSPAFLADVAKMGASELVTVNKGEVDGHAVISYETTNETGGTPYEHRGYSQGYTAFEYIDNIGRGGNMFRLHLFIKPDIARSLVDAVERTPGLIRKLADKFMREQIGANDAWGKSKPPYERWKQINKGVNRIALMDLSKTDGDLKNAKILEF